MFKFVLLVTILPENADRASAGKILTQSTQNIPGSALQGLKAQLHSKNLEAMMTIYSISCKYDKQSYQILLNIIK